MYLHSVGVVQRIHNIPPKELNSHLYNFFKHVRKGDGEEYEPASLRGMAASFDRYLESYNYGYAIFQSKEFADTKEVIQKRMKQLFQKGKGNFDQRSHTLTDADVNQLFQTGQLGYKDPETLLRTMWFFNTVYFGIKSSKEHHQLKWGDITLCFDERDNVEFLEYRSQQNVVSEHVRVVFANTGDLLRCPVTYYKMYRDLRPEAFSNCENPFYLVSTNGIQQSWYRPQAVGLNKLSRLMSVMAREAGIYIHIH
jgi:hypothetical protein